ncbi:MAG: hypothetical protein IJ649_03805 [Oscillospiraceae bacterium]|nr:hypothetical protein [Oscillospiraceae bacterium]
MNARKTYKPSRLTPVVEKAAKLPTPLRKLAGAVLIPLLLLYFYWIKFRLWLLDEFHINSAWLKLLLVMILSYAAIVALIHR